MFSCNSIVGSVFFFFLMFEFYGHKLLLGIENELNIENYLICPSLVKEIVLRNFVLL